MIPHKYFQEEGGVMTLTDVYCRFNRARGMEVDRIIHCSTLKASFILYMETLLSFLDLGSKNLTVAAL